jgi:hypothetical protein
LALFPALEATTHNPSAYYLTVLSNSKVKISLASPKAIALLQFMTYIAPPVE